MVKVKVRQRYYDIKLDRPIQKGEELELNEMRAKKLSGMNLVEVIETVVEKPTEILPEPEITVTDLPVKKKKKRARRKKK